MIKLPQGWLAVKYDTLQALIEHLDERNYGIAVDIVHNLLIKGEKE